MTWNRSLLNISYEDTVTNEDQKTETEIEVVWPHLKVFWLSKDHSIAGSANTFRTEKGKRSGEQSKRWATNSK